MPVSLQLTKDKLKALAMLSGEEVVFPSCNCDCYKPMRSVLLEVFTKIHNRHITKQANPGTRPDFLMSFKVYQAFYLEKHVREHCEALEEPYNHFAREVADQINQKIS